MVKTLINVFLRVVVVATWKEDLKRPSVLVLCQKSCDKMSCIEKTVWSRCRLCLEAKYHVQDVMDYNFLFNFEDYTLRKGEVREV